ncbi:hypothetical protein VOLCADRAFT_97060 [Volvox carteri f. nagariensis]|uniref:TELO2 ARM repeat domain-containing protein n=1 Tax=Volvox carteri f. nagariensis TaxID=3068 RepID=D8UBS8_VOLCA|nr:uncharacterized protein VOLCADRAFT_97060 [Volvox carteri f. nagariensis]EFJ42875.1 hypothetical protein VOLCADRAFT_97060 [Volvox carteri f. nagariensis]|eukprot:XP_002956135.1 hypothetical protein VOLCADRAFT_97060 [Volvox carteri f. nagariensis]
MVNQWSSHLSMVTPLRLRATSAAGGASSGTEGPRGARGEGRRFAAPGCCGVSELLLHLAVHSALTRGSLSALAAEAAATGTAVREQPPSPLPSTEGPGHDRGQQSPASEGVLGMLLPLLLLLPPAAPSSEATPSSSLSLRGTVAGMYGGLYSAASLAALLVSVPDRAGGLLAAAAAASPELSELQRLQPEAFYWRLLQQLMAALANPGRSVAAATARLRRGLDKCTASLASWDVADGGALRGCRLSYTKAANGEGTCDDGPGPVGGDYGGGGLSGTGVAVLEPLVAAAAVDLLAEVLERLAKRGYAAVAADALLSCTTSLRAAYDVIEGHDSDDDGSSRRLQEGCTAALLQLADVSSAALERLLAALLDRAARPALAATAGNQLSPPRPTPTPTPQQQRLQQELQQLQQREALLGLSPPPLPPAAAAAALSALLWLLPPALTSHPAVSYTLTDRLLLSLQRPPLPLDCLRLLTALLAAAYPATQPAAAAVTLASTWGDAAAVTRTSVQRQAYLTQALLLVLARLDRETVEVTPGLLTGLLGGVSQRLGSPLVATQRQAMRVGRGFSLVLDPASAQRRQLVWRGPPSPGRDAGLACTGAEEEGAAASVATAAATKTSRQPFCTAAASSATAAGGGGGGSVEPSPEGHDDVDSDSICTATDSDDEETDGGEDAEYGSGDGSDGDELRPLGTVDEMEGDAEAEAWHRAEPAALQLRALAAALRKQDDVKTVLAALKQLEVSYGIVRHAEVIRAAPDELGLMAPELIRSLLHCRVPEWAEMEADVDEQSAGGSEEEVTHGSPGRPAPGEGPNLGVGRGGVGRSRQGPTGVVGPAGRSAVGAAAAAVAAAGSSSALAQRRRSLVALLALVPLAAGDALLPEIYSPHLDMHQRLTLLDALAAAAAELADPRVAPRLTQGPGGRPLLTRPETTIHQPHALPPSTRKAPVGQRTGYVGGGGNASVDRSAVGVVRGGGPRTRVWAPVALRKLKEQEEAAAAAAAAGGGVGSGGPAAGSGGGGGGGAFRNRFADVALRWAAGLLREVDKVKHGVDLLGRDHQLLGRVLTTLATFAEAAAGSTAMTSLARATLELIRAPQVTWGGVHSHPEPYVRRAALLAAGQVLAQLPPPAVAGALLGATAAAAGTAGAGGVVVVVGGCDGCGDGLAERLEWVSRWCRTVSEDDVDPHCRLMAQACVNLQADLASRCLASLRDAAAAGTAAPLASATLPTVDLARTARLLAASPAPSLHGGGGGIEEKRMGVMDTT